MDRHSVNVYKEEEISSPFLYTTHLYFLVIHTSILYVYSFIQKIHQVYCLDSVLSGHLLVHLASSKHVFYIVSYKGRFFALTVSLPKHTHPWRSLIEDNRKSTKQTFPPLLCSLLFPLLSKLFQLR